MQKESPLGFKKLDWFADIELFQDQAAHKAGRMAEVPQLFGSQAQNDAAYYRLSKPAPSMRQIKKADVNAKNAAAPANIGAAASPMGEKERNKKKKKRAKKMTWYMTRIRWNWQRKRT